MYCLRVIVLLLLSLYSSMCVANTIVDPPEDGYWHEKIEKIYFSNARVVDVLQGLAKQYSLNLIADPSLSANVSLYLHDLSPWELIVFLANEYPIDFQWSGSILHARSLDRSLNSQEVGGENLTLSRQDSTVTLHAKAVPIEQFSRLVADSLEINLVYTPSLQASISGRLVNLEPILAVSYLLESNGLVVQQRERTLFLERAGPEYRPRRRHSRSISLQDTLIGIHIQDAEIGEVLGEIAERTKTDLVIYSAPSGRITISADSLNVEEAFSLLFQNTAHTYRRSGQRYLVGDSGMQSLASSELVALAHIKSDRALEMLPQSLTKNAEIREIKEHNSLLVVAEKNLVRQIREHLAMVDKRVPQILLEAMVVDYNLNDDRIFKIEAGVDESLGSEPLSMGFYPFISGKVSKSGLQLYGDGLSNALNTNIAQLPDNFYATINMMNQVGAANVRSKPHLATLNGHSATLTVSTTQYFIFETETVVPNQGGATTQTSQRFEQISADVKLEITPWVSAGGEVTVEITQELSTPVGSFSPEVPPTINSRSITSTVRLQDGETIVLGGLITETDTDTQSRFPILGSLPFIGRFFRNSTTSTSTSELVIYLTPQVNFESELEVEPDSLQLLHDSSED